MAIHFDEILALIRTPGDLKAALRLGSRDRAISLAVRRLGQDQNSGSGDRRLAGLCLVDGEYL